MTIYNYHSMQNKWGVHGTCSRRNMPCSPDDVHTYPFVILELLSAVSAALIPPLWSVLRIKVKEPLSEGKLGRKTEGGGSGAEVMMWMRGKKSQRQMHKSQAGFSKRMAGDSARWEQPCASPSFHRGSILRRGERRAEINRNKSRPRPNEMHHPELSPAAD